MNNNKTFLAIIIGAVIIGGCAYYGLQNGQQKKKPSVIVTSKISSQTPMQSQPQTQIKNNSVAQSSNTETCGASQNTIVTKVIDGDTVVVEGGWHVRLLGMDADEKGYPCYDQARIGLENLVLGKNVMLQKDVSDVDQYGRCLRYIFINNINVDAQLVKEGLAVARFYEPDVKYRAEITSAESYAEVNKIGCKWVK